MDRSTSSKQDLIEEVDELNQRIIDLNINASQLIETQSKMQSLLHHASDAVIQVSGEDGSIQSINLVAQTVFGYSEMELLYQPVTQLVPCPSEFNDNLLGYLESVIDGNTHSISNGREIIGLAKNGDTIYLHASISKPQKNDMLLFEDYIEVESADAITKIDDYLCIFRDITKDREMLHELTLHKTKMDSLVAERTKDLEFERASAEKANQSKSEFLANMSHELRTPMHAILSFSALGAKRTGDNERLSKYFNRIDQSGQRLLDLIDDLLDLSKAQAGKAELSYEPCDFIVLFDDLRSELESLLLKKNLCLDIQEEHGQHSTVVTADRKKILHITRNLLSNAIKFTPEGETITISLDFTQQYKIGEPFHDEHLIDVLIISVKDKGIGIPDDELTMIFNQFAQSSKTKDGAGGTGLGLAIAKEFVELHGGQIYAENNPEGGAIFTFWLPCEAQPLKK